MITLIFFSCNHTEVFKPQIQQIKKTNSLQNSEAQTQVSLPPPYIGHSSSIIDMKFTFVSLSYSQTLHRVDIYRSYNNASLGSFYQSILSTDNTSSVSQQITNKTLTGVFTIYQSGYIIEKWTYKKGVLISSYSISLNPSTKQTNIPNQLAPNTCTFAVVHNCVAQDIKNMGFFEYGACLLASVECYSALWLDCVFDNC